MHCDTGTLLGKKELKPREQRWFDPWPLVSVWFWHWLTLLRSVMLGWFVFLLELRLSVDFIYRHVYSNFPRNFSWFGRRTPVTVTSSPNGETTYAIKLFQHCNNSTTPQTSIKLSDYYKLTVQPWSSAVKASADE